MKLYTRRGHWQVEFEHDGKRKRLALGLPDTASKDDATKSATDRMKKFFMANLSGNTGPLGNRIVSMGEALNHAYLTQWRLQKSGRKLTYTLNSLTNQIGHWMMNTLSYNQLLDLQQRWIGEDWAPATINRYFSMIRTAYTLACKVDTTIAHTEFPKKLRVSNERDRFVTEDEEATILNYIDRRIASEQAMGETNEWVEIRDLYLLLVDTGARLGEVAGDEKKPRITTANIHGTQGKRRLVLRTGTTKNDKPREIPMSARAEAAALRWLTYPQRDQGWYQWRWKYVRENCKVPDVNLHILRHTCAVKLLKNGVSIYTVSKWLGHSSVKITERYSHVIPDMLDDALARMTRRDTEVT